eukprot:scaffold44_cov339-Pavlova_lutheri.AAC.48
MRHSGCQQWEALGFQDEFAGQQRGSERPGALLHRGPFHDAGCTTCCSSSPSRSGFNPRLGVPFRRAPSCVWDGTLAFLS